MDCLMKKTDRKKKKAYPRKSEFAQRRGARNAIHKRAPYPYCHIEREYDVDTVPIRIEDKIRPNDTLIYYEARSMWTAEVCDVGLYGRVSDDLLVGASSRVEAHRAYRRNAPAW